MVMGDGCARIVTNLFRLFSLTRGLPVNLTIDLSIESREDALDAVFCKVLKLGIGVALRYAFKPELISALRIKLQLHAFKEIGLHEAEVSSFFGDILDTALPDQCDAL